MASAFIYTGSDIFCDACKGGNVHYDAADIERKFAFRNGFAGCVVNKNFFTALRICCGHGFNNDCAVFFGKFLHCFNSLGFVIFDADDNFFYAEIFFEKLDAFKNIVCSVGHGKGISGDIGFALCTVENNFLNLRKIFNGKLYKGGEACAAKTYSNRWVCLLCLPGIWVRER